MMKLRERVSGKISRGNDAGLTELGLIIVCAVIAVAVIIIILAALGKL